MQYFIRFVPYVLLLLSLPVLAPFLLGFAVNFNPAFFFPPNTTALVEASSNIHTALLGVQSGHGTILNFYYYDVVVLAYECGLHLFTLVLLLLVAFVVCGLMTELYK